MIKIDDHYIIEIDEYNYVLKKIQKPKKERKSDEDVYRAVGYYRTLADAVSSYYKKTITDHLLDAGDMDLKEAVEKVAQISEEVTRTIENIMPDIKVKKKEKS